MSDLSRIEVAIDSELLEKFDQLINKRGYTNRSEAFRDLIRDELVQKTWQSPESNVVGTVTLVYDHHVRLLNEKLTDLQHENHKSILSTLTCIWIMTTVWKCWWSRAKRARSAKSRMLSSAPRA